MKWVVVKKYGKSSVRIFGGNKETRGKSEVRTFGGKVTMVAAILAKGREVNVTKLDQSEACFSATLIILLEMFCMNVLHGGNNLQKVCVHKFNKKDDCGKNCKHERVVLYTKKPSLSQTCKTTRDSVYVVAVVILPIIQDQDALG